MRANGAYTCLVSGGFTLFTSRIGAMIGFDEDRANTLVVDRRHDSPAWSSEPILGREAKLATLNELRAALWAGAARTRWRSATAPTTFR